MPNTTAEYRLLEVAIYDLKTENNKLRKDKERLDWILEHCDVGYDKFYKTSFENRKEIDKAMEDYGVPNSE